MALKDGFVIVQDLYHQEHEVIRVLTDGGGKIPTLDLHPGLYRAIATGSVRSVANGSTRVFSWGKAQAAGTECTSDVESRIR